MVGAVLAGGKNSRMGCPKAFIEVGGRRIIDSTIDTLAACLGNVVISTNDPARYFYLDVPLIGDIYKDAGPMAGILSVLVSTNELEVFVTACDMPFIKPELVSYIARHSGRDATVPVFNGRPEPLLAVYTENAIRHMEYAIENGNRSMREILKEIDVFFIDESDIREIDPYGRSFSNINTFEDFDLVSNEIQGGGICLV